MKEAGAKARRDLGDIVFSRSVRVPIPDTRRRVKIKGIKPYTIERLTALWQESEEEIPEDGADTLKSMCRDPYFNHKQAALLVLNGWFRIHLFYGLLWRWWAYVRGYEEYQLTDILREGKKKIPLHPYWTNMVLTVDMRADWTGMTKKEAEQYRAELMSAAEQLSQKNSRNTPDL